MGTKVNNNYEDIINFVRASSTNGTGAMALRPVSYGSELVQNGTFDTDSDWVKTQATISGGVCEINSPSGSYAGIYQAIPVTVGKMYFISVEVVSVVSGSALVNVEGSSVGTLTTSGFITTAYVATDDTLTVEIKRGGGVTEFTIDNVSVKEVTFDQPDGTLTLFPHPENVPRVEWDSAGNRLGLLVEEQRVNLFTYSEKLSEKDHDMSTTDNATIAPNGNQTASFCKPTTSSAEHYIDDATVTLGTDYAMSCFAKQGPGDYLLAFRGAGIGSNPPRFNLETGTIENTGSSDWSDVKIEDIGNGWYRCSAVANPSSTLPFRFQIVRSDGAANFAGDGTSGLYIWGCQIEQASFPTSYIKSNSGSTTSRSADVASIPVADFGYNQSAGTLLVDFSFKYNDGDIGFPRVVELGNSGNSGDRINVYVAESNGNLAAGLNTNSVNQGGLVLKSATGGSVSSVVAFGWAKDNVAASDDGDPVVTDSSADILPTGYSRDTIKFGGGTTNAGANITGHIKSFKYYPRRLTNAQLEDLSS